MADEANSVLFYEKPMVLDRVKHRSSRVKVRDIGFDFARKTNSVPLAAAEFPRAALEFPIVFAGPGPDRLMQVAILGLHDRENCFIDSSGKWTVGYIPAFIRRYPFVLAEKTQGQDFSVCVDTSFPGWDNQDGETIFDEQGQETPFLKNVLAFLGQYQGNIQQTQVFTKRLTELNLLTSRELRVREAGEKSLVLRGFYAVDEVRLQQLSDVDLVQLARSGFLALIYTHLISLGNVSKLESLLKATPTA